jgi:hypothetical protein
MQGTTLGRQELISVSTQVEHVSNDGGEKALAHEPKQFRVVCPIHKVVSDFQRRAYTPADPDPLMIS